MPRGPKWTEEENSFLTGVLASHGDKPRKWSEEVRAMVKARLASRTESGLYQQTLKILKGRGDSVEPNTEFTLATGA
jgi:hypothetical protein